MVEVAGCAPQPNIDSPGTAALLISTTVSTVKDGAGEKAMLGDKTD